ncbi:hypothetical protein GW813_03440 [bacterium]|nr:hypothetical protein [bacterium]
MVDIDAEGRTETTTEIEHHGHPSRTAGIAAAAMTFNSVFVVMIALRLRRITL